LLIACIFRSITDFDIRNNFKRKPTDRFASGDIKIKNGPACRRAGWNFIQKSMVDFGNYFISLVIKEQVYE